jgi:DNA-directed RNA polymerase II subunit RPB1
VNTMSASFKGSPSGFPYASPALSPVVPVFTPDSPDFTLVPPGFSPTPPGFSPAVPGITPVPEIPDPATDPNSQQQSFIPFPDTQNWRNNNAYVNSVFSSNSEWANWYMQVIDTTAPSPSPDPYSSSLALSPEQAANIEPYTPSPSLSLDSDIVPSPLYDEASPGSQTGSGGPVGMLAQMLMGNLGGPPDGDMPSSAVANGAECGRGEPIF